MDYSQYWNQGGGGYQDDPEPYNQQPYMGMPYNPNGRRSKNRRNAYQGGYQGWQGAQYFQGGMPNSGGQNIAYGGGYQQPGMQGGYGQYPGYQMRKRGPGGRAVMPYQNYPQMQTYGNYRY